jgi:hypothetical protein
VRHAHKFTGKADILNPSLSIASSSSLSAYRSLGTHISKIKHINLDYFEDSQIKNLMDIGNAKSKLIYEKRIPACYRIPKINDPQILLEQFIRAKYERKEFSGTQMPSYSE